MRGPVVRVEWLDIMGDDTWTELDRIDKVQPVVCTSVGVVQHDDDKLLRIVSSWHEIDGSMVVGGVTAIPRACVVSITKIGKEK